MYPNLRNLQNKSWATIVLAALLWSAPAALNGAWAGDDAGKSQASPHSPKLREVAEVAEDYVGKEFTFTVRISTNDYWMRRAGAYFFLFLEDLEGTKLPARGFSPDSTVNYIRFILPLDQGRKLIASLNASQKYEARVRFSIERERALLGQGWQYIGRISSVEVLNAPKTR